MDIYQDAQSPRGSPNLPPTQTANHFMKELAVRKAEKRPVSHLSSSAQEHLNGTSE